MTPEENDLMTRVAPGTRMGALLRRYWHPVAASGELVHKPTKRVRILGEDLVLFRDRLGKLGLIDESCPHRRASLAYGIPTERGLRCPYHGWMFDAKGSCIEQPFEGERHALHGKQALKAYPVEEIAGLIYAYLGPAPAPLLPRFEALVWPRAIRSVGKRIINCNWLQCMENTADPVHTEWLHGALHEYRHEQTGAKTRIKQKHVKIAFDAFEFGLIKRRLYEGQSESAHDWTVGHPLVFPNMLLTGSNGGLWKAHNYQIRVPIDDEHTMHYWYHAYVPPDAAEVPDHLLTQVPPVYRANLQDESGDYNLDLIDAQDVMCWETQGRIADRSREMLGASDRGVVEYRRMLKREMEKSERGEDPLGVVRDPAANVAIRLPLEEGKDMYYDGFESMTRRQMVSQSPILEDLLRVFAQANPAKPPVAGVAK